MQALRNAVSYRPGFKVISTSTRWYRPTPRHLYRPVFEPYTWKAWMWYRRDGAPRSKWKGVFYGEPCLCIINQLCYGLTQDASRDCVFYRAFN
jgi:hypothetical protein